MSTTRTPAEVMAEAMYPVLTHNRIAEYDDIAATDADSDDGESQERYLDAAMTALTALAESPDVVERLVTAAGLHSLVECSHVGDGPTQRWWLCEECSWESPRSRTLVPRDALRHQIDAALAALGGEGR